MNYRTFADVVMHMVYNTQYDLNVLWGSDKRIVEVTYGMPFNDYMELTSELMSNNMIIPPTPGPTGFITKQIRLNEVVVNIVKSESLALRTGGLEEGDEYYGTQAPVIQMQTLPNRA